MSTALERTLLDTRDFATKKDIHLEELPDLLQPAIQKADFFSNDYLSLSTNPKVRDAFLFKLMNEDRILGSRGSRLQDGNTPLIVGLEARLKEYFRGPAALVYNSGFEANFALWRTLPQKGDVVIVDQLIHASIYDGLRMSAACDSVIPLRHSSIPHLRKILTDLVRTRTLIQEGKSSVFVITEGVFSMHGDFAPLKEISNAMKEILPTGVGQLFVDEAHSVGIVGPQGRGLVCMLGMEGEVALRLYTFSKAMGTSGAVIIASPTIRRYLIHCSRNMIYSTTFTQSNIISMDNAVDIVESEMGDGLRRKTQAIASYARNAIEGTLRMVPKDIISVQTDGPGFCVEGKYSPMIPLVTPKAVALTEYLTEALYSPREIVSPVVPVGHERLRVTLHAGNTKEEVDDFVGALAKWILEQMRHREPVKVARGERARAML